MHQTSVHAGLQTADDAALDLIPDNISMLDITEISLKEGRECGDQ